MGYPQTNRKIDTGKTLTRWPVFVDHFIHNFIYQTRSYLELWLPMLETNNRSYLTVAIGCTGGKHRSVYIAEQLADYFRSRGKNVQSRHRTLEKRKP
ncbi:hypothetical protein CBL23_09520 [Shigella sonnei]|nr:hypothetical protein CBL23_09520 [Shigella sonnei]